MDLLTIAIISSGFLLYSLVSGRLQSTIITAPLVFTIFGLAAGADGFNIADISVDHSAIHFVAELTLILVLFTDAARIDFTRLRRDHNLPVRMLLIGLPLAIAGGTLVALGMFPSFLFWEAALLAALLAPTDAALGQAVISARVVPVRIRQAINVESGLNDGIALPAVLLFAALAGAGQHDSGTGEWIRFVVLQLVLGPLVGIVAGYVGARLIDTAAKRDWTSESFQGIGILSLAIFTYVAAELIGGNGFIAAFIGGMMFGKTVRNSCAFLYEFMETEGQLLMLITFLVFGAALLPEAIEHVTPMVFLYAILSLTLIRMVPIALSLLGTGLRMPSQLFLGWFGPRGLASILFVLLILEESKLEHRDELLTITVITVALSILLHGITAAPFARLYGNLAARMGECEENLPAVELPLRVGFIKKDVLGNEKNSIKTMG
jgi:NhaP-type Na+/H+ or K+/H+ antiporter